MLFAYDIVLVDETRDGVNAKLERWQVALKCKGFKISCTRWNIWIVTLAGMHIETAETTMRIENHEIPQSNSFCYLGSIISKDEDIDEDVEHRVKAG